MELDRFDRKVTVAKARDAPVVERTCRHNNLVGKGCLIHYERVISNNLDALFCIRKQTTSIVRDSTGLFVHDMCRGLHARTVGRTDGLMIKTYTEYWQTALELQRIGPWNSARSGGRRPSAQTPEHINRPRPVPGGCRTPHNKAERLVSTVAPARAVRPGDGSRDSRSSSPWPCSAAIFCRPVLGRAAGPASSRAGPRCSTIRRTPSSLTATCTAVAP